MKRRTFIAGLGGAAAWPLVARAQQPAMPVIGFIGMRTATEGYGSFVQGLSETGFVDHQNVTINYRAAKDADELSAIAVDLTRKAVICGPANAIAAAKTATDAIPMVFIGAADPIAAGLVLSFNRLGGNVTGVRLNAGELPEKSLELLHELVPTAKTIGLLINPKFSNAEPDTVVMLRVSGALGIQVIIDRIIAENDLDAAFQRFAQEGVDAVLVNENLFFVSYRDRVASLAIRYNIPMAATSRYFTRAGGLMSYGADVPDVIRQAGIYVGRILKGEKPADMPVLQPTKFDFVINLKTAKALGLTIPPQLLARADEVIE
jgi:putative tryptophan/tyrosine transport system substrate-binding protein